MVVNLYVCLFTVTELGVLAPNGKNTVNCNTSVTNLKVYYFNCTVLKTNTPLKLIVKCYIKFRSTKRLNVQMSKRFKR